MQTKSLSSPQSIAWIERFSMGATMSWLAKRFLAKRDLKILMVGLDASGKTTILHKLKLGDAVTTVPTIGISRENSFLP